MNLTAKQAEFISYVRTIYEGELEVKIANGDPQSWWVTGPAYKDEYRVEYVNGDGLDIFENRMIEEMIELEFGELVIEKREGRLISGLARKHYIAGQGKSDRKIK